MVCSECALSFFADPLKMGIVLVSLVIALSSLLMILRKNIPVGLRVGLVYLHVFGLLFPLVFYFFFSGCQQLFSGCDKFMAIIYMLGLTGLVSAIAGTFLAPVVFIIAKSRSAIKLEGTFINDFVEKESESLGIKQPRIYVVDDARPFAFSFSSIRPFIFVSAGLLDMTTKSEAQAIMLHELSHVKSGSSMLKFSAFFMKLFSPLSMFASFRHDLNSEELQADNFAIEKQGSCRHLCTAKRKVNDYFESSGELL